MIVDPARVSEIELQPVHSKGELVVDEWWRPQAAPEPEPLHRRFWLEALTLVAPLAMALIYQLIIAAPRYVSESEFMVRTLANADMGNLSTLLTDQKVTRASDETYAVSEYLTSRDAVDTLVRHDDLRAVLNSPQADFINRFPNFYTPDTRERLYRHFQDYVYLRVSNDSGIATLRTVAFTPQDALKLNHALLNNAEQFVNRLNGDVFSDALAVAQREVEAKKAALTGIEARLTDFRNAHDVLDPNKEVADALSRIGSLMTKLSSAESGLAQTVELTPHAPQIGALTSEVTALRDQISIERRKLAGQRNSLSSKFGEFDAIVLDRTLAAKQLEAALAEYDRARQDAGRQHFYLQTVVAPEAPDQAAQPTRLLNILAVAGFCLCVYSILRALIKNVREHNP